jgi:hypothetical protein
MSKEAEMTWEQMQDAASSLVLATAAQEDLGQIEDLATLVLSLCKHLDKRAYEDE